jgi:uncharacterized protein (DUF1800 family)
MLMHPLVHAGARMVKPPIVQIAGMLRGIDRYIDTDAWVWESSLVGQTPFYPPNVGGWDPTQWLNTATWLGRFNLTSQMIVPKQVLNPSTDKVAGNARELTEHAIDFWGRPTLSKATVAALRSYAQTAGFDAATAKWEAEQYPVIALNALRALVVASPDYQAC